MAFLASLRKPERHVVGVIRFLEIRQVAADAGRRRSFVSSTDVTGHAVQRRVHSCQRETGVLQVVKPASQPGIDGVTLFALRRKPAGHVIRRVRLRESTLMTGVALDRQPLKLSDGFALVAVRAIQSGVAAHKREAVVVLAHRLQDEVPSLHGVTSLATGAHLATMNVGVAIRAMRTGV